MFKIRAQHKKNQKQTIFTCSSYEELLDTIQKVFQLPKVRIIQPLIKNQQTLLKQSSKVQADAYLKLVFIEVVELEKEEEAKLKEKAKKFIYCYEKQAQEKYQENIIAYFALLLRKIQKILKICLQYDNTYSPMNMVKKDYSKTIKFLNSSIKYIQYEKNSFLEKKALDLMASLMICCEFQKFQFTDSEATRFFRKILRIFEKQMGENENLWELVYCINDEQHKKMKCSFLEYKLKERKGHNFEHNLFQQLLSRNQKATSMTVLEFPEFLFIKMCKFLEKEQGQFLPQEHFLKNYSQEQKDKNKRQICELFQSLQSSQEKQSFPLEIQVNSSYNLEQEAKKREDPVKYELISCLCVPFFKKKPGAIQTKIQNFLVIEQEQQGWLTFQGETIGKYDTLKYIKDEKWRDFIGLYQRR